MNRDELLTQLAMELAEWPRYLQGNAYEAKIQEGWVLISESDWQQRRTELINEPDDSEALEGFEWKCQDADGLWKFTNSRPEIATNEDGDQEDFWVADVHYCVEDGKIPAGHDWRTTLREVKCEPKRELNPPTSSLTNSQAREYAIESGTCSDGNPCHGQGEYCPDCPNAPHAQDARRLDAQLSADMGAAFDKINPNHHRKGDIECIDAIKAATVGKTGIEAVCVANVIKYLWRYEEKNGIEDIEKALWYINRLHDEVHD